jgi:hypothetical protein
LLCFARCQTSGTASGQTAPVENGDPGADLLGCPAGEFGPVLKVALRQESSHGMIRQSTIKLYLNVRFLK